jgi:hypothetical protein
MAAKILRKYCISDKMDGKEDEEELGNIGSEQDSVSRECERDDRYFKDMKAQTYDGNGEYSETGEAE